MSITDNLTKGRVKVSVKLHPDLLLRLGFSETKDPRWLVDKDSAPNCVDLNAGFYNLYVYTDIVKSNRVVGHTLQPLLRSVPVAGSDGEMVLYEPRIVDYLPLRFKTLQQVEVYLTTDIGELVQFQQGKVSVTLHIRKARFL